MRHIFWNLQPLLIPWMIVYLDPLKRYPSPLKPDSGILIFPEGLSGRETSIGGAIPGTTLIRGETATT